MIKISEISRRRIIMATTPSEGIQDYYLFTLNMNTLENPNIKNKSVVGLPENDRCDLTRSNWTDF